MRMKEICRVGLLAGAMGYAGAAATAGEEERVAYLGVATTPPGAALSSQLDLAPGTGLLVAHVDPAGAVAELLQVNDVLVKLDDQLLVNHAQLAVLVRAHEIGETVSLSYVRGGETLTAEVALGERVMAPAPTTLVPPHGAEHMREIYEAMRRGGRQMAGAFRDRRDADRIFADVQAQLAEVLEDFESRRDVLHEVSNAIHRAHRFVPELRREMKRISSGSVTTSIIENGEKMTLSTVNGKAHLRIIDADGEALFDGGVETDEEQAAVPEEYRERFERLEVIGGMNAGPEDDTIF